MLTLDDCKQYHFMMALAKMEGIPYRWMGDDPSGFDCSGMVVELLKVSGHLKEREDFSANGLWQRYHLRYEVTKPRKGALCFYFKDGVAIHVVVCLDAYYGMGANGGGRTVVDDQSAQDENAFIKRRLLDYRSNERKYVYLFNE